MPFGIGRALKGKGGNPSSMFQAIAALLAQQEGLRDTLTRDGDEGGGENMPTHYEGTQMAPRVGSQRPRGQTPGAPDAMAGPIGAIAQLLSGMHAYGVFGESRMNDADVTEGNARRETAPPAAASPAAAPAIAPLQGSGTGPITGGGLGRPATDTGAVTALARERRRRGRHVAAAGQRGGRQPLGV